MLPTVPVVPHDRPSTTLLFHPAELHAAILTTTDHLFFVSVTLSGTLRARWYLVAVDLAQTAAAFDRCGDPASTGMYYVHFYTRHPSDTSETDVSARWWPEWHEFTRDSDGVIDYGKQFLVHPTRTPRADRYIAWADTVHLCDPTLRLLGPFDFVEPRLNPPGRSVSFRQYVPVVVWADLAECKVRRFLQGICANFLHQAAVTAVFANPTLVGNFDATVNFISNFAARVSTTGGRGRGKGCGEEGRGCGRGGRGCGRGQGGRAGRGGRGSGGRGTGGHRIHTGNYSNEDWTALSPDEKQQVYVLREKIKRAVSEKVFGRH